MSMPDRTVIIMKGDDYMMYGDATVVFDNVEEAEDLLRLLGDGDAEIKEAIFFADAKIKWSDIKDEVLSDLE